MISALENLCGPDGPLSKEPPDAKEFAGLRQSALHRLADAEKASNSIESRFDSVDERLVTDLIHAIKVVAKALDKLPPL